MGRKRGSGGWDACGARRKIGRGAFLEVTSAELMGVGLLSSRLPTAKVSLLRP